MLHVRIIAPSDGAEQITALLEADPAVCDVIRLPGSRPGGPDLVLCDVARERASGLMVDVERLELGDSVSISLIEIAAMVSAGGTAAVAAAGGRPSDGVVWEEVEERTRQRAGLSFTYLAFMIIATLIGVVGVLVDSQVLIVGAMIVGPDFGPLAGLCVAVADRRPRLVRRSLTALVVGYAAAMLLGIALALVVSAVGAAPVAFGGDTQVFSQFTSLPDGFSVLVAVLAGVGGLLTITQARSGALIGILVSVTTIPAVSNAAVAIAYGDGSHAWGALLQLLANVVAFVAAGVATYGVQRASFRRRTSVVTSSTRSGE